MSGPHPGDRDVELLDGLPRMGPLLLRSAVPDLSRGPARLPSRTVGVAGVQQDRSRLADYARVCGFPLRDAVPPTWLHVLTFPLQMHLLSSPDSSIGLAGVVHVANRMTLHRPVDAAERLELSVWAEGLRPHQRGALLDFVGQARVGDELVWDGVTTYLSPGAPLAGDPEPTAREPFEAVPPIATWRLPADLGRQYRRVSGDPNPIHTSRLAARAFGFARPIVHGMWTHARLLAALEPRLPAAYTVDVAFARPILLPASVGAWWRREGDSWRAAVTTQDGAKPYLRASVAA